jgi:2-polyprenyl-3-methyl-5-hydroxy-6-metoxy-1,4-benzoquinol methylase
MSPLSNSYLSAAQLNQVERFYPLHAYVCAKCLLVQLQAFESAEAIFSDYAYFSSYSQTWLDHAKAYTEKMIDRFGFNASSQVIEIASNDGYLLQYFKQSGVPALGIEPAANVAKVAQERGIATLVQFFGVRTAADLSARGVCADLLLGNNVLAHVPDLHDFVGGMKIVLKADGVITLEFPHLLRLIEENQFDTIYHEHFSYFSLLSVEKVLARHKLRIFDVEQLSTHGGSLRIFACHAEDAAKPAAARVEQLKREESGAGLAELGLYQEFTEKVKHTKRTLLAFLIEAKHAGKSIAGYGAPAKGNTLLNYCGIRADFVDYTVDLSPHKQGHFLPGTHLPIYHPERIRETKPDYLLLLPWNLKDEIVSQMAYIREWGGKFVLPIPEVRVLE